MFFESSNERKVVFNIFDESLVPKDGKFRYVRRLIQKTLADESEPQFLPAEIVTVKEHITRFFVAEDMDVFSVYFHLHDNIAKELVFLRPFARPLTFLEVSARNFVHNPAKEGGNSLFGIMDSEATVMLTATYEPIFELNVDFHSNQDFE